MNAVSESGRNAFIEKYGVEPEYLLPAMKDDRIRVVLHHLYLDAMEDLRECNLKEDGERIQGEAVAYWNLLNIQKEIENIIGKQE
jgi:hypothetical protein